MTAHCWCGSGLLHDPLLHAWRTSHPALSSWQWPSSGHLAESGISREVVNNVKMKSARKLQKMPINAEFILLFLSAFCNTEHNETV